MRSRREQGAGRLQPVRGPERSANKPSLSQSSSTRESIRLDWLGLSPSLLCGAASLPPVDYWYVLSAGDAATCRYSQLPTRPTCCETGSAKVRWPIGGEAPWGDDSRHFGAAEFIADRAGIGGRWISSLQTVQRFNGCCSRRVIRLSSSSTAASLSHLLRFFLAHLLILASRSCRKLWYGCEFLLQYI